MEKGLAQYDTLIESIKEAKAKNNERLTEIINSEMVNTFSELTGAENVTIKSSLAQLNRFGYYIQDQEFSRIISIIKNIN